MHLLLLADGLALYTFKLFSLFQLIFQTFPSTDGSSMVSTQGYRSVNEVRLLIDLTLELSSVKFIVKASVFIYLFIF